MWRKTPFIIGGLIILSSLIGFVVSKYLPAPIDGHEIGIPFSLVNHYNEPVSEEIFVGHPSLVFFGFTQCPDICPTTLSDMAAYRTQLGTKGADLRIYFITLDPARDTPAILSTYIPYFGENIIGITGAQAPIAAVARAWGIYWEKESIGDGDTDYTLNHTASIFMLNRAGRFVGTISHQENEAVIIRKLENLINR